MRAEGIERPRLDRGWNPFATAIVIAVLMVCIFIPYYTFAPLRVGDGAEYYALFLAIKNGHHLWMTSPTFALYDSLVSSQSIGEMIPTQILYDSFPALRIGATADFNHFWMYSLLAALVARAAELIGLQLSPHHAFVTLHLMLALCTVWLAQALYGWRGAIAAAALLMLSPMVWYFDKVHTELFTVCLVTAAVMLVQIRHLAWGAACLALASTQNPSFAIVALALLIWRAATVSRVPLRFLEVCGIVTTVLAALLHPAYYYFRHGVLTPQLLAGGAALGGHARSFSIWLLDLDVGLLPNWPLGVLLLATGVVFWSTRKQRIRIDRPFALFILGFTLVNLFAQSSTTNINSGATPGLARYALWYIPLFFPLALRSTIWLSSRPLALRCLAAVAAAVYAALNFLTYDPRSGEDYTHPSLASKFIQQHVPALYDPPLDVFQKRYSGLGDRPDSKGVLAILGPSCDKLLLTPGPENHTIENASKCTVDVEKIKVFAEALAGKDLQTRYVRLPNGGRDFIMTMDRAYATARGTTGVLMLNSGWHAFEDWGTWAAKPIAELSIPCPRRDGAFRVAFSLSSFLKDRDARIVADDRVLWSGKVAAAPSTDATITIPPDQCVKGLAHLALLSDSMDVPKTLGLSGDERALGIGLTKITYLP